MSYKVALNQQDDYDQLLIEKHQKNNATPSTSCILNYRLHPSSCGAKKWQKPYLKHPVDGSFPPTAGQHNFLMSFSFQDKFGQS